MFAYLERTLGRPVVLEGVQEEGRALLHHVLLHKHVHNLVDVGQGLVILNQHLSELGSCLRVRPRQIKKWDTLHSFLYKKQT